MTDESPEHVIMTLHEIEQGHRNKWKETLEEGDELGSAYHRGYIDGLARAQNVIRDDSPRTAEFEIGDESFVLRGRQIGELWDRIDPEMSLEDKISELEAVANDGEHD